MTITDSPTDAVENDRRWAAVVARDTSDDETFLYGVQTTGVYCKPSCPARRPRRENVRFFDTVREAEEAGLRPCRRCKPDDPGSRTRRAAVVARACRVIEGAETGPDLAALADEVGVSPFHLHRLFKAETGITPKAYADAYRAGRARRELHDFASVTDAIYGAGFNSSGPFYASSNGRLGMTPTEYRSGGPDVEVRFAVAQCSLGAILVASSERGVCAIEFGDDPSELVQDLADRFHAARLVGDDPAFDALVARVVALVENPSLGDDLPLDVRGTTFQERVWRALREVPVGSTVTYGELATRIGAPGSARAVAHACAANRLAVAVPCHRVARRDGEPSGYRWGLHRKAALLAREARPESRPEENGR